MPGSQVRTSEPLTEEKGTGPRRPHNSLHDAVMPDIEIVAAEYGRLILARLRTH